MVSAKESGSIRTRYRSDVWRHVTSGRMTSRTEGIRWYYTVRYGNQSAIRCGEQCRVYSFMVVQIVASAVFRQLIRSQLYNASTRPARCLVIFACALKHVAHGANDFGSFNTNSSTRTVWHGYVLVLDSVLKWSLIVRRHSSLLILCNGIFINKKFSLRWWNVRAANLQRW